MPEREFIRPGVARVTTDRYGRWYEWGGEKYWSVTTILKTRHKYALEWWFKQTTALAAVENYEMLGGLIQAGKKGAVDWLHNASDRARDQRAGIGTRIHDHAEAFVLNQPMPPIQGETDEETAELQSIMESFYDFLAGYKPEFVMVEAPIFSVSQQYAGTLDFIADFDRSLFPEAALRIILGDDFNKHMDSGRDTIRLLGDYKTGKGVYEEVALQLTPYRNAEHVGLPDGNMDPMPTVDGAIVVHLRDGVMDVYPVSTSDVHWKTFLYIREVYRWNRDGKKGAIGKPVVLANRQIALDT